MNRNYLKLYSNALAKEDEVRYNATVPPSSRASEFNVTEAAEAYTRAMNVDLLLSRSRIASLSYAVLDRVDFPNEYPGLYSIYWSAMMQV